MYTDTSSASSGSSPISTHSLQRDNTVQWTAILGPPPPDILSSLFTSFARSIDGRDVDTGHHLAFNFGAFLHDIPRHLGSNESLDTAADALVSGYDHFLRHERSTPPSMVCLRKYSRAVKSLRKGLSTVEDACEPATLCAIQLVMMVEVRKASSVSQPTK